MLDVDELNLFLIYYYTFFQHEPELFFCIVLGLLVLM